MALSLKIAWCQFCQYYSQIQQLNLEKESEIKFLYLLCVKSLNEKKTNIFSSLQPDGLMTQLMGENMMRKDGQAHLIERKAIFPTVSPKTVRDVWKTQFEENTKNIINKIKNNKKANLMTEIAMPASAHMLKVMTGLTNMTDEEKSALNASINKWAGIGTQVAVKPCHKSSTCYVISIIDQLCPIIYFTIIR